jgi:23S rRNA (cytosine1962-C5)-methyltransferase
MARLADLRRLPNPSATRLAVRVSPAAARQVRGGHPWVYDESIVSLSREGAPGELAVIFDDHRAFMAIGLYDPSSPIRIKVLHHGKPATIDARWWRQRLAAAADRRAPVVADGTTGYRLVNGENDGFPGLVLDRYATTLVLKLYSTAWVPHLGDVLGEVVDAIHPERVVLRLARNLDPAELHELSEGLAVIGTPPDGPVLFTEHGLTFEADVIGGQKTGHFLDQRDNRQLLRTMSAGRRVLDVFASSGGFGVYAAAGGALEVVSVDISAPALDAARRNMVLNHGITSVAACRHRTIDGDAFEVLDRLARSGERFDAVVVDPPSFAQRQSSVERALAAYAQLTRRALAVLRPGGLLVQASCSSRIGAEEFVATVRRAAGLAGHELHEVRRTGHAVDHPVTFPEGAYLKALFATT